MPLTIVIRLPRISLVPQVQSLARTLTPLAGPLLGMAVDASGLGLPARLLLHAALHTALQQRPAHSETGEGTPPAVPVAPLTSSGMPT
ncbi:hypothetical protein ACH4ZX_02385 [Streptomyces sp. NPDC020490]|uniref:hypothetical protein n=1 Tax=Streptomyces sp. NPDC020490 TaxID=3365078 RepID=UPI00379D44B1